MASVLFLLELIAFVLVVAWICGVDSGAGLPFVNALFAMRGEPGAPAKAARTRWTARSPDAASPAEPAASAEPTAPDEPAAPAVPARSAPLATPAWRRTLRPAQAAWRR